MNSNYERRSAADLREKQKQMIAQAESVQKTVAVTEPNWQALIASLKMVTETEAQILERLNLLATDTDVQATLQNLYYALEIRFVDLDVLLHEYDKQISGTAQEAEKTITAATQDAQKKIASMTTSTEAHCGQLSEKFSKAISEEQQSLRTWMQRCLLISAIPSLLLVILELILHLC